MVHKIFADRVEGQQRGVLTLQRVDGNGRVTKLFERLPFSSGQRGYTTRDHDWTVAKGATPFGNHWMTTRKVPLQMEPKGTPFYAIGSVKGSNIIQGTDGKKRTACGIHLENDYEGTIGCLGVLHDTPERECLAWAFFEYLDRLAKYEPFIAIIVL